MNAPARFALAGVMGSPVMHSRSPLLHGHWLAQHGIAGAYLPLTVRPDGLAAALRALAPLGFVGVNLTIPLKEAALALVDRVEPIAARIGAVNCVVVERDGSLGGRNTDGIGFLESVRAGAPGLRIGAEPIVVAGAGGAARAILVALADAGARDVRLLNRTDARSTALARDIGEPVVALAWAERQSALAGAALLVNATSQGMMGQAPLDLDLDALPEAAVVADIVYTPLETPLLRAARRRGLVAVDGLGMLIEQGRPAFEAWFGVRPAATRALRDLLKATL